MQTTNEMVNYIQRDEVGYLGSEMSNLLPMVAMTTRERKVAQMKSYFKELTAKGKEEYAGVGRRYIRAQIRQVLRNHRNTTPSQFAGMPSRRQRRFAAKMNGDLFVPVYN
ncbi:hypothetical protein [Paenibacillus sp. MMO-177]|uniref:hypothetical protein n=1 Tax=Paenibacillus sp. MMO-177 TaxID=3081289 RepID=UPI003016D704